MSDLDGVRGALTVRVLFAAAVLQAALPWLASEMVLN